MPLYHLTPHDLLFFRDSRPMESNVGSGGHGACWPAPSVFFDAIHAALWRAFPHVQPWEDKHRSGRSSHRDMRLQFTERFGSLATTGPFPVLNQDWLFPCPGDVTHIGDTALDLLRPLEGDPGISNLPVKWLLPLASLSLPSKQTPAPWWNKSAFVNYLWGHAPTTGLHERETLFESEWTTGIGMDAESGTQDGERIYSAEYLRLRQGVGIGLHAVLPLKSDGTEAMDRLFNGSGHIVAGGQQRVCLVTRQTHLSLTSVLPVGLAADQITTPRVKWVLLSPAVWPAIKHTNENGDVMHNRNGEPIQPHPGGWLPNWICPKTGHVLLKPGDVARHNREPRRDWRKRMHALPDFSQSTKLIAARVPKTQLITGWSDELRLDAKDKSKRAPGPKATYLGVPAGAVYYFACANNDEAKALVAALNWHGGDLHSPAILNRRSTLMGEKGFGIGVCGTWAPLCISDTH